MLPNRKIKISLLFISIITVIAYTIYNEITLKPFNFEEVENNVYRFQTYDAELNEAIVLSRYGILEQYDSINYSVSSLEERVQDLRRISVKIKNDHLHDLLANLTNSLHTKRDLIEQFKEDNTILKIAILHFSSTLSKLIESQTHEEVVEACLSGQFSYELTDLTNTLYRDMLVYVNTANPNLKNSLISTVTKLRTLQEASPELLNGLTYADLILINEPKVEQIAKQIFNVKTMNALSDLNSEFRRDFDKYLRQSNVNRILLYVFSAILLCLLIWSFRRIQSTIGQLNAEVIERKRAQEDLRLVNQDLEGRVKERTQQLTDKNKDLEKTLKKLKNTQEQLVLHEKMASVGMLTAGISHELKNPLNFVNNFSEASVDLIKELKTELDAFIANPSDTAKSFLDDILNDLGLNAAKILEHGKRADKIVENMRLHSQDTPASKESTDVNKLVEEQIDLAYHNCLAKNKDFKVSIIKNLNDDVGFLTLIPQTMGRAILNIAMNAMYYLEKKAEIQHNFEPELVISTSKTAQYIVIKIRDNGMGIPEANSRKIFEPFFTTKPTGEGTGLGLSIAYDTIVKEHNGEISVKSQEGEYTEFVIHLPCQNES